jgi:hypothetical protein
MARLTKATRAKIPTKEFAGPGRSFPIENASHARAALSMAHNAANPAAIRAKVKAKYPSIGAPKNHDEFHKLGTPKGGKY